MLTSSNYYVVAAALWVHLHLHLHLHMMPLWGLFLHAGSAP